MSFPVKQCAREQQADSILTTSAIRIASWGGVLILRIHHTKGMKSPNDLRIIAPVSFAI